MNTPVVFLIFNRPDLTEQVFQAIAQAKPNRLLVVADWPRNENERVLCEQAREIIKKVDWPCEVQTNFSETNLETSLKFRPSTITSKSNPPDIK